MQLPNHLLVSVVIPTLNAGPRFAETLEAIQRQESSAELEIVVIDSGSRDGTPEMARNAGAMVVSIPRRQFNHGRARNRAIEASRGEFIVLTVQDATPTDNHWLSRLFAPLLATPEIAGSYGAQVCPPSAGLLARTRSALWREAHAVPLLKSLPAPDAFWEMPPEERLALISFDNVTSCLRRSVWQALPLPERNFGEDIAWAKEVLFANYKIAYVPAARVWHSHERSWLYELRRAYVDGCTRGQLLRWPCLDLKISEVLALFRRLAFFLTTRRFDPMTKPAEIQHFLVAELDHYGAITTNPIKIYKEALDFSWGLWQKAMELCPEGILPQGAWSEFVQFAYVAVAGENLGTTAAAKQRCSAWGERLGWTGLHRFLGQGV